MRAFYRLSLRALYHLDNKSLYRLARLFYLPRISNIQLHITDLCNYRCIYCYAKDAGSSLEKKDWVGILRQAKQSLGIRKVSILGGEPLCAPYLEEILIEAKRLAIKPYLYTNGALLTDEWIDMLRRYKAIVVFKYEYNNELYQKYTQQYTTSLDDLEKKIRQCSSQGLRSMTFTALHKQNIQHAEAIFDNSLRLGALPALERYLPVCEDAINKLLEVSEEEYSAAMKKIAYRMRHVMKEWLAALRIAGRGCGCFIDNLTILSSGETLPCPYLPEKLSLGNIKKEPLEKIYKRYQEKNATEYKPGGQCDKCSQEAECGGGCFTYAYLKEGRLRPYCNADNSIGFCSFLLIDLYDDIAKIKL